MEAANNLLAQSLVGKGTDHRGDNQQTVHFGSDDCWVIDYGLQNWLRSCDNTNNPPTRKSSISQGWSLFSAKIELFRKADFKNTSFQNIPSDLALVPRSNGFWVNENDEM